MAGMSSASSEYDIILDNVSWTYSGSSEPAIKNISLKVRRGEILVITGPSGAG
jgi:ABC-type multidrug transport system fused ATPase/permease subunit